MARELSQIMADPQPFECVRLSPTSVVRVTRRDPIMVTYRTETVGAAAIERGVGLTEWRALIRDGNPCEPRNSWP